MESVSGIRQSNVRSVPLTLAPTHDAATSPPTSMWQVKVAVRCKPITFFEASKGDKPAVAVHGQTVSLRLGEAEPQAFSFDHAFGPSADQMSIFSECGAPLVAQLLDGFNATVFAYGQVCNSPLRWAHLRFWSGIAAGLLRENSRPLLA